MPGGDPAARPLHVFSGGFLTDPRLRAILRAAGRPVTLGWPGRDGTVAVWGRRPVSARGRWVAERSGVGVVTVEDAFLRSVLPGRSGEGTLGLILDETGVHYDGSGPSRLEGLITQSDHLSERQRARAEAGIDRLRHLHLSKYNADVPGTPLPPEGHVLVVDQTRGDASVTASGADRARFAGMLAAARADHPGARIVVRTHPETRAGHRQGYFGPADATEGVQLDDAPSNPWEVLARARAVYTVTSQIGFEAILAGHRPVVFGQPFYAGWGLTDDRVAQPERRTGVEGVDAVALFHAAMIDAPVWYDAYRDRLTDFETICEHLEVLRRAWRSDRGGYVLGGMRLWKRGPLQRALGRQVRVRFDDDPARAAATASDEGRRLAVWAGRATEDWQAAAADRDIPLIRVEDGFLRSNGLGAELVPPLSLALDDCGIYYDPSHASRLETLIARAEHLPPHAIARAERLIERIAARGLTKYNVGHRDLTIAERLAGNERPVVLVPGQVEDDASIRTGARGTRTNLGLLQVTRAARPEALILYKPHPDVEAGLRDGAVDPAAIHSLADIVCSETDPASLLLLADEVWTITSLMGFEALLRGVRVTTLGVPFYAGWGLTEDLATVPERRRSRPGLAGLVHAALIDYPRYFDPVTGLPAPVEVIADRLVAGQDMPRSLPNRSLSKLQGMFASYARFWR